MGAEPPKPQLPDGVDDDEYRRIRNLMRVSVLRVWRKGDVIAGIDPWDSVDEAWASMAESNFQCKGPFVQFAIRVAKNKAMDALRRAEARRRCDSIDAPLPSHQEDDLTLHDVVTGGQSAETVYMRGLVDVAAAERLSLYEEAIYEDSVLTDLERDVFLAVRVDRKSRAAVGRDLPSPLTGQRVGQIVAEAFRKIDEYARQKEGVGEPAQADDMKGGNTHGSD